MDALLIGLQILVVVFASIAAFASLMAVRCFSRATEKYIHTEIQSEEFGKCVWNPKKRKRMFDKEV